MKDPNKKRYWTNKWHQIQVLFDFMFMKYNTNKKEHRDNFNEPTNTHIFIWYQADAASQWSYNRRLKSRRIGCLLNCLFRLRSNKTWKLRIIGLCEGDSPVTGELLSQRASNAENISLWCRHHGFQIWHKFTCRSKLNGIWKKNYFLIICISW